MVLGGFIYFNRVGYVKKKFKKKTFKEEWQKKDLKLYDSTKHRLIYI